MRIVLQRVAHASVTVSGETVGKIGKGFMLLVAVGHEDSEADAVMLAQKIAKLRIFSDQAGKMNLSLGDVGGSILSISQFTLFASTQKGNRPSFLGSAKPEPAKALWETFNDLLRAQNIEVQTGIFAANMQVELLNDGPVTLWLDSKAGEA